MKTKYVIALVASFFALGYVICYFQSQKVIFETRLTTSLSTHIAIELLDPIYHECCPIAKIAAFDLNLNHSESYSDYRECLNHVAKQIKSNCSCQEEILDEINMTLASHLVERLEK